MSNARNLSKGLIEGRFEVNHSENSASAFPSGDWAAKVYNQFDAPNEGGLVVANRWEASASSAFLVGGLHDGGDGFNEYLKVDGIGHVTMPKQPAFWAYNVTGSSTQTSGTITFPQTDINTGNHYNTSTGRFTAPISGVYEFNVMVLHRMVNVGGAAEITLLLNGANVSSRGLAYSGGSSGQGDLHIPQHITYRRSLSAGDYVQPYIHAMGGGQDFYLHSRLSYFTGRLIG